MFEVLAVQAWHKLLPFTGGSETFQDKVNFFQRELRQVHMKRPHSKVTLKVSRHCLLESVSVQVTSLTPSAFSILFLHLSA